MPTANKRIKMRQKIYNTHLGKRIAALIAQGYSLEKICNNEELRKKHRITVSTTNTVRRWIREIPEFTIMVEQAYRDRADVHLDHYMDTIQEVKDGTLDVKIGEFITTRQQWLIEKTHPAMKEEKGKNTLQINAAEGAAIQIIMADPVAKALPKPNKEVTHEVIHEGEWSEAEEG